MKLSWYCCSPLASYLQKAMYSHASAKHPASKTSLPLVLPMHPPSWVHEGAGVCITLGDIILIFPLHFRPTCLAEQCLTVETPVYHTATHASWAALHPWPMPAMSCVWRPVMTPEQLCTHHLSSWPSQGQSSAPARRKAWWAALDHLASVPPLVLGAVLVTGAMEIPLV